MENLDRSALRELVDQTDGVFTSIYMPTHRTGADIRQDPIRFRNLLKQAEESLIAGGTRRGEAHEVLAQARQLLDDPDFWQHQSDGLAIFAGRGFYRRYRLPLAFKESVVVADRLHVKPLLPLFIESGEFYVLALSQNQVRLLHCTRHNVAEAPLEGVPKSLAEALKTTVVEKHVQLHTPPKPHAGSPNGIYHSQGDIQDEANKKKNVHEFLHLVSKGVVKALAGKAAPLVLAGTDFLRGAFRETCPYPNVMAAGIAGNPERERLTDLRDRGWAVVQPLIAQSVRHAFDQFRTAAGAAQASRLIEEVVSAAFQGRIASLIVAVDTQRWGRYDVLTQRVEIHGERQPGDHDLLDFAAVHTMLHNGQVLAIPADGLLHQSPVAAIFRRPGAFTQPPAVIAS